MYDADKNGLTISVGDIVLNDNGVYYEISQNDLGLILIDSDGDFRSTVELERNYIVKIENPASELNKLEAKRKVFTSGIVSLMGRMENGF